MSWEYWTPEPEPAPEEVRPSVAKLVNRIADQKREITRLRAALREIAKVTYGWEPGVWSDEEARNYFASLFFGAQAKARAAMGGDA